MKNVETYSNWCEIDQLDGVTLKDGEWLRVKWPDGTKTRAKVRVEQTSYRISDMGSPCDIPVSKAFVRVPYKGASARIRLAEHKDIKCERIEKTSQGEKSK
jgi:hypothetical protein